MTIGAMIGSSFWIRLDPSPGVAPPSRAMTSGVCSPKTFWTIRSPSWVSIWSRSAPSAVVSCCSTAFISDAAPSGSAALACIPPSRAGIAVRVTSSASLWSTPRAAATWSIGTWLRISSISDIWPTPSSPNASRRRLALSA